MTKYWLKIGLGAGLIFVVGFSLLSMVRHVKGSVESNRDITIPLGAFGVYLPFKLEGSKVGTLRAVVIQRSTPKTITGFVVRVRLTDSAVVKSLATCRLSVGDPTNFDENTTFTCLTAETGFLPFGEVRMELRSDHGSQVFTQPLLLPEHVVRDIRSGAEDSARAQLADSLAREVEGQVRVRARVISDSLRAGSLEERAREMQRRADSIRANSPRLAKPPTP